MGGSPNLRHTYQTIFVRMIVNAWGSYLMPNACGKYQKVVCISFCVYLSAIEVGVDVMMEMMSTKPCATFDKLGKGPIFVAWRSRAEMIQIRRTRILLPADEKSIYILGLIDRGIAYLSRAWAWVRRRMRFSCWAHPTTLNVICASLQTEGLSMFILCFFLVC